MNWSLFFNKIFPFSNEISSFSSFVPDDAFTLRFFKVLPTCRAEWPTSQLGFLLQAQPPPPLVLLLPWHFPYSQGTRVPHPGGVFSHTSVPCFPTRLYYKRKEKWLVCKSDVWLTALVFYYSTMKSVAYTHKHTHINTHMGKNTMLAWAKYFSVMSDSI